jgi:hypothetical protein
MDKGLTGTAEGFDGPSAGRLGAHSFIPIHNPPEHKMADAIRKVVAGGAVGCEHRVCLPAQPAEVVCVAWTGQCLCSRGDSRLTQHSKCELCRCSR